MSRDISEEERLAMEIASSWGAGTKVEGAPRRTVWTAIAPRVLVVQSDTSGAAKTTDYSSKYDEGASTANEGLGVEEIVVKPAAPNFLSHARRLLFLKLVKQGHKSLGKRVVRLFSDCDLRIEAKPRGAMWCLCSGASASCRDAAFRSYKCWDK